MVKPFCEEIETILAHAPGMAVLRMVTIGSPWLAAGEHAQSAIAADHIRRSVALSPDGTLVATAARRRAPM